MATRRRSSSFGGLQHAQELQHAVAEHWSRAALTQAQPERSSPQLRLLQRIILALKAHVRLASAEEVPSLFLSAIPSAEINRALACLSCWPQEEPLPELEPPLLGSCLIHMLRRLPEPLVSCVKGGMQPRSHLISAQVLATEERARLYSMQLMLDLVAEANREALSSLMSLLAHLLGPAGVRQGAVVLHLARLFAPLVFGASSQATEQQTLPMQETLAQEQVVVRFIRHHGFLFLKDLEPANFLHPSVKRSTQRPTPPTPLSTVPGSQPLAEVLAGSGSSRRTPKRLITVAASIDQRQREGILQPGDRSLFAMANRVQATRQLQDANLRHAASGPPNKLQRTHMPPLAAGSAETPSRRCVNSTYQNGQWPVGKENPDVSGRDLQQAARSGHPSMAAYLPGMRADGAADPGTARSGAMQYMGFEESWQQLSHQSRQQALRPVQPMSDVARVPDGATPGNWNQRSEAKPDAPDTRDGSQMDIHTPVPDTPASGTQPWQPPGSARLVLKPHPRLQRKSLSGGAEVAGATAASSSATSQKKAWRPPGKLPYTGRDPRIKEVPEYLLLGPRRIESPSRSRGLDMSQGSEWADLSLTVSTHGAEHATSASAGMSQQSARDSFIGPAHPQILAFYPHDDTSEAQYGCGPKPLHSRGGGQLAHGATVDRNRSDSIDQTPPHMSIAAESIASLLGERCNQPSMGNDPCPGSSRTRHIEQSAWDNASLEGPEWASCQTQHRSGLSVHGYPTSGGGPAASYQQQQQQQTLEAGHAAESWAPSHHTGALERQLQPVGRVSAELEPYWRSPAEDHYLPQRLKSPDSSPGSMAQSPSPKSVDQSCSRTSDDVHAAGPRQAHQHAAPDEVVDVQQYQDWPDRTGLSRQSALCDPPMQPAGRVHEQPAGLSRQSALCDPPMQPAGRGLTLKEADGRHSNGAMATNTTFRGSFDNSKRGNEHMGSDQSSRGSTVGSRRQFDDQAAQLTQKGDSDMGNEAQQSLSGSQELASEGSGESVVYEFGDGSGISQQVRLLQPAVSHLLQPAGALSPAILASGFSSSDSTCFVGDRAQDVCTFSAGSPPQQFLPDKRKYGYDTMASPALERQTLESSLEYHGAHRQHEASPEAFPRRNSGDPFFRQKDMMEANHIELSAPDEPQSFQHSETSLPHKEGPSNFTHPGLARDVPLIVRSRSSGSAVQEIGQERTHNLAGQTEDGSVFADSPVPQCSEDPLPLNGRPWGPTWGHQSASPTASHLSPLQAGLASGRRSAEWDQLSPSNAPSWAIASHAAEPSDCANHSHGLRPVDPDVCPSGQIFKDPSNFRQFQAELDSTKGADSLPNVCPEAHEGTKWELSEVAQGSKHEANAKGQSQVDGPLGAGLSRHDAVQVSDGDGDDAAASPKSAWDNSLSDQGSPYTVHKIHMLAAKMRNYCMTPTSSPFRWMRHASDIDPHSNPEQADAGMVEFASSTFSPLQPSASQHSHARSFSPASPIFNPLQPRHPTGSPLIEAGAALVVSSPCAIPLQHEQSGDSGQTHTHVELEGHPQKSSSPGWLDSSSFDPMGSAAKQLAEGNQCAIIPEPAPFQDAHLQGQAQTLQHASMAAAVSARHDIPEPATNSGRSVREGRASAGDTDQETGATPTTAPDSALQPQRLLDRLDAESQEAAKVAAAGKAVLPEAQTRHSKGSPVKESLHAQHPGRTSPTSPLPLQPLRQNASAAAQRAADRSLANLVLAKGAAHQARHTPSKSVLKTAAKGPQPQLHGSPALGVPNQKERRAIIPQFPDPRQTHTPPRASGVGVVQGPQLSGGQPAGAVEAPLTSPTVYHSQGQPTAASNRSPTHASGTPVRSVLVPEAASELHHHADKEVSNEKLTAIHGAGLEARDAALHGRVQQAESARDEGSPAAASIQQWTVRGDTLVAPTPEQLGALRKHLKAAEEKMLQFSQQQGSSKYDKIPTPGPHPSSRSFAARGPASARSSNDSAPGSLSDEASRTDDNLEHATPDQPGDDALIGQRGAADGNSQQTASLASSKQAAVPSGKASNGPASLQAAKASLKGSLERIFAGRTGSVTPAGASTSFPASQAASPGKNGGVMQAGDAPHTSSTPFTPAIEGIVGILPTSGFALAQALHGRGTTMTATSRRHSRGGSDGDLADVLHVPAGIALDDLIKLGQEIVPAAKSHSRPGTPAVNAADMNPMELALYLAAQAPSKAEAEVALRNPSPDSRSSSARRKSATGGTSRLASLSSAVEQQGPAQGQGKAKGGPPPPPPLPGSKKGGLPTPPPPPGPKRGAEGSHLARQQTIRQSSPAGVAKVRASKDQQRKLKQLHWDKIRAPTEGTVWSRTSRAAPLNFAELESLFQIMENGALRRLARVRSTEISLIEHRRAHNICIELSGIRLPFPEIKAALLQMDDSALSLEHLDALSRAIPDDIERRDIQSFLQGSHPKHKGVSDPNLLGTVERYFLQVMDIPRLKQRIQAFIFSRSFSSTINRARGQLEALQKASEQLQASTDFMTLLQAVLALGNHLNKGTMRGAASGFKLDTLLKLADVKGTDRRTSLLHFVVRQLIASQPSVEQLSQQLAASKQAADIQVSAINGSVEELRSGLKQIHGEIMKASGLDDEQEASAHEQFSNAMLTFHEGASRQFSELESCGKTAHEELKKVTEFFGESYDALDPSRILRIVRDFMRLFDKSTKEIQIEKDKAEAERVKTEKKAELVKKQEEAKQKAETAKKVRAEEAQRKKLAAEAARCSPHSPIRFIGLPDDEDDKVATQQGGRDAANTPLRIRIRGLSDEGGPTDTSLTAQEPQAGADGNQIPQPGNGPGGPIRPITSPMHAGRLPDSLWAPDPDPAADISLQQKQDEFPNALSSQADLAADEAAAVIQRASEGQDQLLRQLDPEGKCSGDAGLNLTGVHRQEDGPVVNIHQTSNGVKLAAHEGSPSTSLAGAVTSKRTLLNIGSSDGSSAR
ncbi:hypothetical protein WJX74_007435 [Apatococcus lobatus]|uniref:Formin-like protein n=1 Tax=Apatococcus lobatus TaxID=904363 RepID=A0AAW1Q5Z1_9CHLO